MSFSFPNNPSINDQSTQNGRTYVWTGNAWEIAANFSLIPSISGGSYINVNTSNDSYIISATGLQPSGDYANFTHNHGNISSSGTIGSISGLLVTTSTNGYLTTSSSITSSYISDFNEAVDDRIGSGLFVAGTGINLNYNDGGNSFTVSTTGVSFNGHTHIASNITDFNSSVSGLLPVISNSANNRILTSDGTPLGISAESDLSFDNTNGRLYTNGYMQIDQTNNRLDDNPYSGKNAALRVYARPSGLSGGSYPPTYVVYGLDVAIHPLTPNNNQNIAYYGGSNSVYIAFPSGITNSGIICGGAFGAFRNVVGSNVGNPWYDDNGTLSYLYGGAISYGHAIGQSGVLGPAPTGVNPYTANAIGLYIAPNKGYGTINYAYDLFIANTNYNTGTFNNHYSIYQDSSNPNYLGGSLSINSGLSAPTLIYNLGTVSGNTAISYSIDKQIQKLTLNGTAVNFTEGSGWDLINKSVDVMLEITVSSTTTVSFDAGFVTDWYNPLPTFSSGKYLVLLRSMGTGVVQGHYIGNKTN